MARRHSPPIPSDRRYDGDWNAFVTDWVNRVDFIATWFFDNGQRRIQGVDFPYNFYDLSPTVVVVDNSKPTLSFHEYNWWAWLDPFSFELWLSIACAILVTGLAERFVEGKLASPYGHQLEALAASTQTERRLVEGCFMYQVRG